MDSRFRSLRGMLGLTIAAGALLLAVPAVAAADTFTVNDDDAPTDVGPGGTCGPRDATTIGEAVTGAGIGDTIRVCAGTYNESVFASPEMQFLGAQAGVDGRDRAVPASEESIVTIEDADGSFALSSSEDVTVDGFTIADNPAGPAVFATTGTEVVNNIVNDTAGAVVGDGVGATVSRNHITDDTGDLNAGVAFDEADGSEIDDNLFDGTASFAAVVLGGGADAGEDITITDNVSNGAGGIGVIGGLDVQIARNTIVDSPLSEVGGILIASSASVDVTRNVVDDPGEFLGAVTLIDIGGGPNFFVDITRNALLGDGDEAGILMPPLTHEGTVDVHFNRIAGNEIGLANGDETFVDATNNWWGCNDGPEDPACDGVDSFGGAGSDFDPWLTLGASADPTSIPSSGGTSQISADLLTNSDGESVQPDFPDDTQVDYATDLGTLDPLFALTDEAVATTTLTAGDETGTATVDATLDNETVSTQVEFTEESEPPACTERIDGTPRKDNLTGTDGSELIRGRGGADKVSGLGDDDCVKGGSGPDKVVGGTGEDRVRGGAGDDRVKARDGESDVVRCGAGDDTAKVDGADQVRGCEEVKRG